MRKQTEQYALLGFAAGGLGLFGYAGYYFIRETGRASRASRRPRQPWEIG
jgi:hypothetical protein